MDPFKTLIIGTPPSRTYTGSATGLLTSANNLSDVADGATAFTNIKQAASTSATGVIEIATQAEATAGTSSSLAITPATLNGVVSASTNTRAPAQGLVFDGTAKIPFSLAAFGTNPATIHFWFNPATLSGNPRLIGASSAIQLLLDASGAQFYTAGGSVYGSALTVGKTTAVTVVINGNGTAVVYTNGVAGTSGNITANLSTAIDTLGGLSSGNIFSGVMSPLIYNRALSAAEVVALYEAGTYKAISTTGLLLAPDAAQAGGGLVWYDTSGNAANITLPASGVSWNVPTSASFSGGWSFGSGGGNVGIGLTNPTSGQLHIQGNSDAASGPNRPRIALTNQAGTAQTWTIQAWQTSGDANLSIYRTAAAGGILLAPTGGNVLIGTTTDGGQKLQVNGAATFAGSVTTGTPSGGTAGAWKLGVRVAATTTLDTTQYLQVDIGGTLYKVALVTS